MRTDRLQIVPGGGVWSRGEGGVVHGEGGVVQWEGGVIQGRGVVQGEGGLSGCTDRLQIVPGGRCCPGGREVLSRRREVLSSGGRCYPGGRCCPGGGRFVLGGGVMTWVGRGVVQRGGRCCPGGGGEGGVVQGREVLSRGMEVLSRGGVVTWAGGRHLPQPCYLSHDAFGVTSPPPPILQNDRHL